MTDVAVITPAYNTEDYLHRCIKSVLEQKGISLHYYVIDDGSNDTSSAIAQYYQRQDGRITFIRKKNEGQGVARNIGISLADAEYLYFLDSDDYLGEGALERLFHTAKTYELDICSPNVPSHYFEKPLERIACLPCKSQFIRTDIVKRNGIVQPNIRSGQDGVFSHLVLAHCTRVGMTRHAQFHYTHAREGSTFAAHLKRHDLVPKLLSQHFSAIEAHYNRFDLWKKNSLRLAGYISDESLRNRLNPHYAHLDKSQRHKCFEVLAYIARKAFAHLPDSYKAIVHPAVRALATESLEDLLERYGTEIINITHHEKYPVSNNINKDGVTICKFGDSAFAWKRSVPGRAAAPTSSSISSPAVTVSRMQPPKEPAVDIILTELGKLRGKLDLALNTINNSTVQLVSGIRSKEATLKSGTRGLVVSLTTLPERLPIVHYAIESIFLQTILPEKVILWVSDRISRKYVMPESLQALVSRGLEIRRVKDVGPHTKLLYALKEFPNSDIVTVDDDIVYPVNTLQALLEQKRKFQGVIVANWARELSFDSEGIVQGIRAGRLLTPPLLERQIEQTKPTVTHPSLLAFPYGTGGVLYPPGALDDRVFDIKTFTELCPKEDDIWFKAMSLLKKTPVVTTSLGINPQHHCVTGSQEVALRYDNHGLGEHSKQMQAVFARFNLYKIVRR